MEIITYVLDGALAHKDSLGTGSVIKTGDVQRMSAGSGIQHSEYNASDENPLHLLQIWIMPNKRDITPSYEEKHFSAAQKRGQLCLIGTQDGREGTLTIQQDVNIYATLLDGTESLSLPLQPDRQIWVQMARGSVAINGVKLNEGDGAAITAEQNLVLDHGRDAEILIFDLAP
jgi:redox-sensitive bicupin YhaK (pirin superfamily)